MLKLHMYLIYKNFLVFYTLHITGHFVGENRSHLGWKIRKGDKYCHTD